LPKAPIKITVFMTVSVCNISMEAMLAERNNK